MDARWPLDGTPRVIRLFEPPPTPYAAGHRGVDLAAASGAVVRAARAGVVSYAGVLAGRGVVAVTHADGMRTTYEPLRVGVTVGASVAAGDLLGLVDGEHAACAPGTCLHWGLRHGGNYLDPLGLLGRGRVRLLPVGAPRAAR